MVMKRELNIKVEKILFILPTLNTGGVERFTVNLAKSLTKMGISTVIIIIKSSTDKNLEIDLGSAGIKLISLDKKLKISLNCLIRLVKIIKQIKPDVIHTQLFIADIYGVLAAILARNFNLVTTEQYDYKVPVIGRVVKRVLNTYFKYFIVKSAALKKFLQEKYHIEGSKIVQIPNAVDTEKFYISDRNYNSDKITVGAIGRLSPEKGFDILLEAMAVLPGHIECLIAGDGLLFDDLSGIIKSFGLVNRVKLIGNIADVPAFYSRIDILAIPSRWESFGLVVLEGGAAGLPVVCADIPALRELIVPEVNGLCFKIGDADSLAERISTLIREPEIRKNLGQALRNLIVSKYHFDKVAGLYLDLYSDIIN